jgi:hypothetical protein
MIIPSEEGIFIPFDPDQNYIMLERARADSKKLRINDEQEPEVIHKILAFSNYVKEKLEKLALLKEERMAEKKHYYE